MIIPKIKPLQKQFEAYKALGFYEKDKNGVLIPESERKKYVFFGGGAGGGKSWWICESRLVNCLRYPYYKSFIGREELKRLKQSTFETFIKVCKFHNIPDSYWKLNSQYNYIEFVNGSKIDLLDLKFLPSDPFYERFGSLEYTDGAIEEAGEIHFLAYDVLKTRIGRHKNEEYNIRATLAITGNPKKNWTYKTFYKPFKEGTLPDDMAFIQALYNDNKFIRNSYKEELTNLKSKIMKQRLMFGNWEYDDDDNCLISYDNIKDLFTNSAEKDNEKYLTADIARYGSDKIIIMLWRGLEVYKIITREKQGIDKTAQDIRDLAETEMIPYSHIIVDEDGVGGGVVDTLRGIKGFVNNSVAIKTKKSEGNFQNLKTQCYYILSEYINDHKISIKTDDIEIKDLIIEELEQVKSKDLDSDNKLRIISKDEIRELIGRSPDYSDTLMMRIYFELRGSSEVRQFIPNHISPLQRNKPYQMNNPMNTERKVVKQFIPPYVYGSVYGRRR
jgi:hypothetical protein